MQYDISDVRALQALDSRGRPTVMARVTLEGGAVGDGISPSGASTGANEAKEKRDGGEYYGGMGVLKAVAGVNTEINAALRGMNALHQSAIDRTLCALDGTRDKSRLGGNAIIAVSMACARAAAAALSLPLYRYLGGVNARRLPMPMMNLLNGGAHADNNLDIQEFMVRPVGFADFPKALAAGAAVYRALGAILKSRGMARSVGDEGGYAPSLERDEDALKLLVEAIQRAGFEPGRDVTLALDMAAGEWACEGGYRLPKRGITADRARMIDYVCSLCDDYPIDSVEDPLGEEDFEGFAALRERLPAVQIVGDDLFTTDPLRLKRGIEKKSATAILIKLNQIATVSETLECVRLAHENGMKTIVSHRSGETEDTFIADLAVAVNAGQIKTGAPARTDRTAKYNRLLAIASQVD